MYDILCGKDEAMYRPIMYTLCMIYWKRWGHVQANHVYVMYDILCGKDEAMYRPIMYTLCMIYWKRWGHVQANHVYVMYDILCGKDEAMYRPIMYTLCMIYCVEKMGPCTGKSESWFACGEGYREVRLR